MKIPWIFEKLKLFALYLNINSDKLQNESNVPRAMLKNKELTNIIELYYELKAYRQAFPNVVLMV
jgi:hypothetical protein